MKRTIITLCTAAVMLLVAPRVKSDTSYLPIVQHNGEKCYYYSAEKGESVYGIINKFGWDAETFMRYNPEATDLKGGQVVYYPCVAEEGQAKATDTAPAPAAQQPVQVSGKAETPTVKASALRNVGKAPETSFDLSAIKPEVYEVKEGDNIAGIAANTHTGVKALFKGNPGLTPDNLAAGMKVRVFPGSDMEHTEYRDVTEKVRSGSKKYKVKRKDTWYSIAHKNHIDTTQLMSANPGVAVLQKGTNIYIPQFKDTVVNKPVPVVDARVNTPEGMRQIYKDAHARVGKDGQLKPAGTLDIAVLVSCDDANGRRRDMEFLRGFMLGLDGKEARGKQIKLIGADLADYGSLTKALKSGDFDYVDVITCSVDKNFPQELVDFCTEKGIMLINVFDAKTDISAITGQGVQLLPPSSYFYDRTSDFLTRVMSDRVFLFVDYDATDDDNMSGAMMDRLRGSGVTKIETLPDAEALALYNFNPALSYTVISDAGTKENITKTLNTLEGIVDKYPNMPLSIVGRPNWMVYSGSLEKLFRKLDTYIPSRFLFDDDSKASKDFTAKYKSFFNAAPLKSMPMYSVMGHDIADYLVDQFIRTDGDLNYAEPAEGLMQLDFRFDRPEVWDGLMNRRVYLLHFTPFSTTDKISL